MKKLLFGTIVTMFTLSALQSTAQMKKGAYVGVNVGYNAGAGNANVDFLDVMNSSNTTTIDESENIKFSFGKGINAGISFGYMFNENIGAELGVQYLIGGKTKYTQTNNGGFGNSLVLLAFMSIWKPGWPGTVSMLMLVIIFGYTLTPSMLHG